MKLYHFFFSITSLIFLTFFSFSQASELEIKTILSVEIQSSINPATYSFLKEAYKRPSDALLIKINTPGGLVSTTKDILTLFGEGKKPIIIWVGPQGASATSAGAILASGAHFLYMADGTNMGAATPIQMSGDIEKKDARNKAINDIVSLVRSLSQARGRTPIKKIRGERVKSFFSLSFKRQHKRP